jgi:hypothetical protein
MRVTMQSSAMDHIRHLAGVIGPRGSTTPQEREASTYVQGRFEAAGLETRWEPFRAPVSGWMPFAIAASTGLLGLALVALGSRLGASVAALLMGVATASVFLEMYFRPNALRPLVPKGDSQNVWARVPAAGEPTRRVVLVGHVDTHRTPWVFTSPARLAFFRVVTTLGVASFVLGTLAFVAIAAFDVDALRAWSLLLGPVFLVVLALTVQPDRTPFTHGANDNASGAAIVVSLAERLAREPLPRTEVWALATGCEEVGSYGAQAFLRRHAAALPGLYAISIDNVGGRGAGVCHTSVEGMVFPLRPAPELVAAAERVALARPELGAYALPYTTLHTDATAFMSRGVPSLSFVGLTPAGVLPDWHQASDTLEHVDAGTVARTEAFVLALLRDLDAS